MSDDDGDDDDDRPLFYAGWDWTGKGQDIYSKVPLKLEVKVGLGEFQKVDARTL